MAWIARVLAGVLEPHQPWESGHIAVAVARQAPAPQRSVSRTGQNRVPVRHPAAAVDDLQRNRTMPLRNYDPAVFSSRQSKAISSRQSKVCIRRKLPAYGPAELQGVLQLTPGFHGHSVLIPTKIESFHKTFQIRTHLS